MTNPKNLFRKAKTLPRQDNDVEGVCENAKAANQQRQVTVQGVVELLELIQLVADVRGITFNLSFVVVPDVVFGQHRGG